VSATKRQISRMHAKNRHPKKREKGQVKADINVTPLVDVVLVLLIIFMVVTPMIVSGVAVDLPRTAHHQEKPDDGKDLMVSITEDKQIWVMTRAVKIKELSQVIDEEMRKDPGKTVFVKGDARVDYGTARKVMEEISKMGIQDVVLGTEEIPDAPRPN